MRRLGIYVFEDDGGDPEAMAVTRDAVMWAGGRTVALPGIADVALAPSMLSKLPREKWSAPRHGTLILHPSLLPRHRGPSSVQHAIAAGDAVTGATWFWADDGLDTGALCEQEMVPILNGDTPGALYYGRILPAAGRALRRALGDLTRGCARRAPQPDDAATYEGRWDGPKPVATGGPA